MSDYKDKVLVQNNDYLGQKEVVELEALQSQVARFNSLVSLILKAGEAEKSYYPLIVKLNEAIGATIVIDKFSLQPIGVQSVIVGVAPDQNSVIRLKNKLIDIEDIDGVEAPLANIVPQVTGGTSFIINFRIKSLDL